MGARACVLGGALGTWENMVVEPGKGGDMAGGGAGCSHCPWVEVGGSVGLAGGVDSCLWGCVVRLLD